MFPFITVGGGLTSYLIQKRKEKKLKQLQHIADMYDMYFCEFYLLDIWEGKQLNKKKKSCLNI